MMRIRPEDFWAMTLVEWRAALAGFAEAHGARGAERISAMRHAELNALLRRFPD